MEHVKQVLSISERRACRVIGQPRGTQRYQKRRLDDEDQLRKRIVYLAGRFGRYGYPRITALLRGEGWLVNHKRVARIWRQEGLKVPAKQPKRGWLWLNDGSTLRLKPEFPKHVWSYDFMQDRTHNGKSFRILNIMDEFTRECLLAKAARSFTHQDVMKHLTDLFCENGVPVHIRSDNGPEFIAKRLRAWLDKLTVKPLFIEPGSPWENGFVESFNGKMRDEFLNGETFYSLKEAEVLLEQWRIYYNTIRPHSSLDYKPPAPRMVIEVQSLQQ